jgi:sec-independent protein translocase protein TatA
MTPLALFGSFGFQELLVVLLIVVFLFGARRIPELARGLGKGISEFRTSLKGGKGDPDELRESDEASNNTEQ